jgi:hypothetical protein
MKYLLYMLCLLPLSVQAIERAQLDKMLATTAAAQSNVYIAGRASIVNLGTNELPKLAQAGSDMALCWQQRLAARICYERIERADAIDALRRHDWRQHPGYDTSWERSMTGPGWKMSNVVVPWLVKEGMWYYYIELMWKRTGELAISPLKGINDYWSRWCLMALAGRPEEEYLRRAMEERLDRDVALQEPDSRELYKSLLDSKQADAVPILVQRFDAFNKREVNGPEVYPGSHAMTYRGMFDPILSFADASHVDLLDSFIADHPTLADLRPKLTDVRARPAQIPKADPLFRLGTTPVKMP